jgi:hypothetical protein
MAPMGPKRPTCSLLKEEGNEESPQKGDRKIFEGGGTENMPDLQSRRRMSQSTHREEYPLSKINEMLASFLPTLVAKMTRGMHR